MGFLPSGLVIAFIIAALVAGGGFLAYRDTGVDVSESPGLASTTLSVNGGEPVVPGSVGPSEPAAPVAPDAPALPTTPGGITPKPFLPPLSYAPTEARPGREIYSLSSPAGDNPNIAEAVFDGFDAVPGELQSASVKVFHTEAVRSVSVVMITDNGSAEHELALSAGDGSAGRWSGEWRVSDTHVSHYRAVIRAVSPKSRAEVTLSFK